MTQLEFHQIMTAIREMNFNEWNGIRSISYEGVYNILRSHLDDGVLSPKPQEVTDESRSS